MIKKRRGYKRPAVRMVIRARINEQIKAPEALVIGSGGENLGVMKVEEALIKAREMGLDLVEIAAEAKPPVLKIVSFDKYRYSQEKLQKKQKQTQKGGELRHIRITPRAASNDLEVKLRKVLEFLNKGDKVEVQLFMKGREKANKDFSKKKLEEFLEKITIPYKTAVPIKYAGRGFNVQIVKQ